jgi:hypothetical protein
VDAQQRRAPVRAHQPVEFLEQEPVTAAAAMVAMQHRLVGSFGPSWEDGRDVCERGGRQASRSGGCQPQGLGGGEEGGLEHTGAGGGGAVGRAGAW